MKARKKWKRICEKSLVYRLKRTNEKMLSSTNAPSLDLGIIDEPTRWNSSHSRHYAAQFPYTILDESFLKHLVNYTIMKSETMQSLFANNSSAKHQDNNDTLNYEMCSMSHNSESAWFSTEFQATLHFMYITILVIAIFGNGIVCFIVCTSSRMQTVTNYFIANLALSDMLMAFFCIPFSFISLFVLQWVEKANPPSSVSLEFSFFLFRLRYWPFGAVICKFVNYVQAISVLVSAYTLVAISIDRYIAIMFPLKPRLSKR